MAGTKRTLLLVEDEAIIAMTETFALENEGYTVVQADSGEQSVELVRDGKKPIDLILMDIDLGAGMDGTQAAREILLHRDIPVVFLSSHTEREMVERTETITSYGYVVKNSGITVLAASIKMAFKLHEAHMECARAEHVLRASEQKFSTVFHSSPAASTITLERDGRFIDVNDSFLQMTGYERSELIGRTAFDLHFWAEPEQGHRLRVLLRKQGTVRNLAYIFRCKSGQTGQALLSAAIIDIGGESCILAEASDISELKRLEDALVESERKYRRIFETVIEGIFQSTPEGKYLLVSPSLARMHGYDSPRQMMEAITDIGRQYYVNLSDRERMKEILASQGRVENFEVEVHRRDGERMWISVNACAEHDAGGLITHYTGTVSPLAPA
jgi:PAS domain S-box-containing protein